jgi:hypothetical protein
MNTDNSFGFLISTVQPASLLQRAPALPQPSLKSKNGEGENDGELLKKMSAGGIPPYDH